MTLQEIEVFLTVVRTGNVSAAAQALYITQPAVSRHMNALERELDCVLLERGRGQRQVELTERGRDFLPAAEKLRHAWLEAMEAPKGEEGRTLRVSSINSLTAYLMPGILRNFAQERPGSNLEYMQMSSNEAYAAVARGEIDLALISDDMYHPQVETTPLFREPMVLLAGGESGLEGVLHPARLDPSKQVRAPWNPEYDLWHSFWFRSGARPRLVLNHMSMLEEVFSWRGDWADIWAVAPVMVARAVAQKTGARICALEDGPPDEIIYTLRGRKRKPELTQAFLECLKRELEKHPDVEIYQ